MLERQLNAQQQSALSAAEVEALVSGRYRDVFSVLGMHAHPSKSLLTLRAYLPGALKVELMDRNSGKQVSGLVQITDSGLFEGTAGRRRKPFDYFFRVQYPEVVLEIEDPYRFPSLLKDEDLYWFAEGTHEGLANWMGATAAVNQGVEGVQFVVWAPSASRVALVGDFNCWNGSQHGMRHHAAAGLWEIFIPGLEDGNTYKYQIQDQSGACLPLKADPYARSMQLRPQTASVVATDLSFEWSDDQWMQTGARADQYQGPVTIYELQAGSWRRKANGDFLSYRELASELIPYVLDLGFTHIQLMPISEYPFDGSWGYQPIGLFAPSSRFGSPSDFKYFVDQCHQHNIGVLLDWVPGHFPTDDHGLGRFDGTCLYEHEDVRKGFHPDWNTLIYNYGRGEVVSFLISNALFWMEQFHIDGLRVDAVASMLYLDYSRKAGEWVPNEEGGRENLEAIALLRQVNSRVYSNYPQAMMVAEESTAWPGVSKPVSEEGLGFGFKWNMGWMNDTLSYMGRDPVHRKFHHGEMTFGLAYGFSENFILPLSHDEVVHGKGSLLQRMPGDPWQKFANLRAYFGFMWTHPGKKLLFMGGEFAQEREWNHDQSLDWHCLEDSAHKNVQSLIRDLNQIYREIPALHALDCDPSGFEWIDHDNSDQSILTYLRRNQDSADLVLVVVNLTPSLYSYYQIGVPVGGFFKEVLNTDSEIYGGSNAGNYGGVNTQAVAYGGYPHSLSITIPPLATAIFRWQP